MEHKGSGFLKVTGILMIIGGVLGIILAILAIMGIAAVALLTNGELVPGILYVAGIVALAGAVVQLIAGIIGVINSKIPEKAGRCIVWGGLVIAMSLLSAILTVVGGDAFPTLSFLLGLIIPGLYIYGAMQNKAS